MRAFKGRCHVCGHDHGANDLQLVATVEPLCEDEGCPHADIPHICVEPIPSGDFCPHCSPCRNGERLAKAERLNSEYDAVLRNIISSLARGGHNDLCLIDPKLAYEKIKWGIDHILEVEENRRVKLQDELCAKNRAKQLEEIRIMKALHEWREDHLSNSQLCDVIDSVFGEVDDNQ
jgi:hypothetical protein